MQYKIKCFIDFNNLEYNTNYSMKPGVTRRLKMAT